MTHYSLYLLPAVAMLGVWGCPRPADDAFEPNDTPETATMLAPGEAVEARVVQDTVDVFSISAAGGSRIRFEVEAVAGEDCVDFAVTGPDGSVLYDDGRLAHQCGRSREPSVQVTGAELIELPDEGGYRISVPVTAPGEYFLTVRELGHADNVFTYAWDYRLTARLE